MADGPSGGCLAGCRQPEKPKALSELTKRWMVLSLLCLSLLGSYWCYDNPAAISNALSAYMGDSSSGSACDASGSDDPYTAGTSSFSFRFNLLYSVYSWPNVILPFFGGYFSDLLGVRLMTVVFVLLILLGQVIFAFGSTFQGEDAGWYIMWVGRTVFGFGGESLSVATSAYLASWFAGKELALSLAINLAFARVGSVLNDNISGAIATNVNVPLALWVGAGVCIISLLSGVALFYIDQSSTALVRANSGLRPQKRESLLAFILCVPAWRRMCGWKAVKDEDEDGEGASAHEPEPPKEEIHLSAALRFPFIFWALTLSCVTVYCTVLPFLNIAAQFIAQKWLVVDVGQRVSMATLDCTDSSDYNKVTTQANGIMSITYAISACTAPFLGGLIDKIGLRAVLNCVAAAVIVGVHTMLGYTTSIPPEVPMVLLGLAYSVYASALWPSVALVIEPKYHATAYGVVTAVQNLGMAVAPLVVGRLQPGASCGTYDHCVSQYTTVELFFIAMGAVGFCCGLLLNWADYRAAYPVLNLSEAAVAKRKAADAAAGEDERSDAPLLGA